MKPLGERGAHYWLLQGMLQHTGADAVSAFAAGELGSAQWAALVEACRGCAEPCACRSLLDDPDASGSTPPAYCRNADALAQLPRRPD